MTESRGGSVGGGGGTSPESLAGYATQIWVNTNFISIEFFNRLFTVLDEDGNAIEPNDTETTIESIQSMFGFWSELYISALGQGSGGSAAITLGMLEDVQLTSPQNGQVLKFNGTKWVNGDGGGGGTDMQTVWDNLAASGSQQINASHLTNALNGYATQAWVGQQGYLTASSISDMATKTWVGNNYLGLHATADAATKLATARTLWGQSFDGTGNVSGDMSSVGNISFSASGKNIGGLMYFDTTNSNIGIGTSSPSYALDVVGFARAKLLFFYNRANTANAGYIGAGSSSVDYIYFQAYTNNGLYIGANNGFDFVILPNHYVGVGTTEPSYKMHVSGTFYASGNSSIGGTLGVAGATTLSSTLSVTSNTTVGGTLGVTGATTLSSTLGVSGATTLSSSLSVTGAPKPRLMT